jgi:hypothetical protein
MNIVPLGFLLSFLFLAARALLLPQYVLCQNPTPPPTKSAQTDRQHTAPEYPGFSQVGLQQRKAIGIGSGPSFATEIHVELVENTPESMACTEILARAQWRQDILLALDGSAHYDNCQFDSTNAYLRKVVLEAESAAKNGNRDQALAALGRALHAVQDFYSHTNYLELAEKKYKAPEDVPILAVWSDEGRSAVADQARNGLISGDVWWEPGARCQSPSHSHAELNKDTPNSPSGKQLIRAWNVTQHQAAKDLARRATLEFLRMEFAKPGMVQLGIQCKGRIGVMLMTDNRSNQ